MRKERKQGEAVPNGYGIAFCDLWRNVDICYPIGIHLIVRLYRRVWEWSFNYRPSKLEKKMIEFEGEIRNREQESRREEIERRAEHHKREMARQEARHQRQLEKIEERHKRQLLAARVQGQQEQAEAMNHQHRFINLPTIEEMGS